MIMYTYHSTHIYIYIESGGERARLADVGIEG